MSRTSAVKLQCQVHLGFDPMLHELAVTPLLSGLQSLPVTESAPTTFLLPQLVSPETLDAQGNSAGNINLQEPAQGEGESFEDHTPPPSSPRGDPKLLTYAAEREL